MNFKVGDVITGINSTSLRYVATTCHGTYRVIRINIDTIRVTVITHESTHHIGDSYNVEPQYFNLVTPAKPRLDTLIKRIKLGQRAQKEMIEHYNDEIEVTENGGSIKFSPSGLFWVSELEFTKLEENND